MELANERLDGRVVDFKQTKCQIICPNAPKIPVTLNNGFVMPSWFDVLSLDEDAPEKESDILRAVDSVHALVDEELIETRLPSERLMLAGFSQGGALALYSALTYHRPLAGILILSSWIPLHKNFPDAATNNTNIPILQCHGMDDPVISFAIGKRTSDILDEFTSKYQFFTYEGLLHQVNDKELADIKVFIRTVLP